jgi:hypothetical protein
MGRSDAAKAWGSLLSELADVPVTVEWERPSWIVRWRDGPTRAALMSRAAALGVHRFGRPLLVEDLLFSRHDSAVAVALGWLATGGPPAGRLADGMAAVEGFCEGIGYPEDRFDDRALGAADLLVRLSGGDRYEMGRLLAQAVPGVPRIGPLPAGPGLRGRTDRRWSRGGPPVELLGPSEPPGAPAPPAASALDGGGEDQPDAPVCAHCGRPLTNSGRGRPAKYCGGTCRTAAHRAHRAAGPGESYR